MQGAWVWALGGEDPLGEEMATRLLIFYLIFKNFPSILAWEIPWTEEPGGLQAMGSQKVAHKWATKQQKQQQQGGYVHSLPLPSRV